MALRKPPGGGWIATSGGSSIAPSASSTSVRRASSTASSGGGSSRSTSCSSRWRIASAMRCKLRAHQRQQLPGTLCDGGAGEGRVDDHRVPEVGADLGREEPLVAVADRRE